MGPTAAAAVLPETLVRVVGAQYGGRLKHAVTQPCFSDDSLGPEVTERLKTCEKGTANK